jgi:hypothetical protein
LKSNLRRIVLAAPEIGMSSRAHDDADPSFEG